jgi:hypothetical protein
MKPIFGPRTQQVLNFLNELWRLSPEQITEVSRAWRKANDLNRAEAWAQLQRTASRNERHRILAAAAVARRQAMDVAHLYHRTDWAFWAAAWDAAAAIAADDGKSRQYEVLTAPITTVLSSLPPERGSAQVPAQRGKRRAEARREAGRATAGHGRQQSAQTDRARDANRQ